MSVISIARELGKAIQEDARYVRYHEIKQKSDNDTELQNMIGEFNMKKLELNTIMAKPEKDQDKINDINDRIKTLYTQIMENPSMTMFTTAKSEMDTMLQQINMIITASANGDDPLTCSVDTTSSCSGSCGGCNGCN